MKAVRQLPFLFVLLFPIVAQAAGPTVFINEIHYDNTGTDTGEFVEIAGPAGTNLTGWSIVLYNGNGGASYDTDPLSGVIPNQQNGFGTVSISYPSNGIQNGSPDGIALVNGTTVVQFLSYEGSFTATTGPANGMLSTDIGVSENGSEPINPVRSLQLQGTGAEYGDFTWTTSAIANTQNAVNTGQTFTGQPGINLSIDNATVTEGNSGTVTATFTVSLNAPAPAGGVTFNIATQDSSATVADNDYQSKSLVNQNIAAGEQTYTFTVAVVGDTFVEPDETFFVNVTSVLGANVGDPQGVGTISNDDVAPPPPADHIVISQVYGGGGNSGATFNRDFVELFNPSTITIDVTGWSVQYAPATGSSNASLVQSLAGSIAPGQYYLIALGSNNTAVGAPLPVEPNVLGDTINLAQAAGKVALVNTSDLLTASCAVADPRVVDYVGYGTTANCHEGAANAPAPSSSTAIFRKSGGSTDTNNNLNDFETGSPNPRRTAPIAEVGPRVVNTDPSTNNSTAPRDSSITIDFSEPVDVVGVWFNITCASTGVHDSVTFAHSGRTQVITPNVNFLAGEQCSVTIFKDAVHDTDLDDLTPATDTLPANYTWTFTVATGTAPPFGPEVHLMMGNPSNAIDLPSVPNNFLMVKPEFALSYNRDRGTANWVSWHLSSEWDGTGERTETFRPDPAVPPEWYRVQEFDYSGSGFNRGHMTPSADRRPNTSIPINQATFLMSNMIPQAPDNNQGPWANLENSLRALLGSNEIYIVAGPAGVGGTGSGGFATTVANGHVTVPASTWKVALVLPKLDGDDVARVTASARTIAVIMPNIQGIRSNPNNALDWQAYLVSVDQVETLTGYDFFANVPDIIENSIEAGINGVNPPGVANQSVSTPEDTQKSFTLEAVSASANPLTYTIVTSPAHGTLTGSDASRTYTPEPDFFGNDSFTFRVSDGALSSTVATVTITISQVNDGPSAVNDDRNTNEDSPLTFAAAGLTANDSVGPVNESGQTLTVTSVSSTAGTHGVVSLSNGQVTYSPELNFNGAASFTYEVCDNGFPSLCATGTVNLTVNSVNDPPSASIAAPADATEGAVVSATASVIDVDSGTFTYAWSVAKNGAPFATGTSATFSFTPDDNGTYAISLVVNDGEGGSGAASTSIAVTNVAPVITSASAPTAPLAVGASALFGVTYTDAGSADTHSAILIWDDGSSSIADCSAGVCTAAHTFNAAGVYTARVILSDDDGGSSTAEFESVIVYDTAAGFATGGGWIDTAVGKANFGFNAKYQKGVPAGETEFRAGSLNFHSSSYDVLVAAGTRAQFRGTGTVNRSGSYGFILTVFDGDVDRFRIRIWERSSGAVVYDNVPGASDDMDDANPQPIGGGNIEIHK